MDRVEAAYRRELASWTGARRVERSAELLSEVRAMLFRKVSSADPRLTPAQVERRVAECLYRSDRETRRLLTTLDE